MKYNVPNISCGHCKASIEAAMSALDPTAAVSVDLDTKTVDITTRESPGAVVAALEQIGFPAQALT